jgi:hypothetical protein
MRQASPEALISRAGGSLIVTLPEEAWGPLLQAEIHRSRVRRRLAEARRPERPRAAQVAARAASLGDAPDIHRADVCWDVCRRAGWSYFELLRSRFRTGVVTPPATTTRPGLEACRPPLLADFLEVE